MESAAQPGRVLLGKYRIERLLGEGGMGLVVAATHFDLGELFAIKLMLPSALADREAVERFLREARAAARLKGEHVARVHDVGRLDDGAPYMVMEHLSGQDLHKVLRARGSSFHNSPRRLPAVPLHEQALACVILTKWNSGPPAPSSLDNLNDGL
jgi:serine/threonine-protein kinase